MNNRLATKYVTAYHKRQLSKGLCRYCPKPLAFDSRQYCADHIAKERAKQGTVTPRSDSHILHEGIISYALANPFSTVVEIAAKLDTSQGTVGGVLMRHNVAGGWAERNPVDEIATFALANPFMAAKEIAVALGVDVSTVQQVLNRNRVSKAWMRRGFE